MNKEPLVSVVMPNYNGDKFIAEAIESVIKQTYCNWELIIVDDCSTDHSWKIISKYVKKDKRIKAFKNKTNFRISKTRNRLLTKISKKAKYVAILDSDDVALPKRLKTQIKFLENNHRYGVTGSNLIIIDEESKTIGNRKYPSSNSQIRRALMRINPIAQSSICIRKEALEGKVYSEDWEVCEDYDLWLRIIKNWDAFNFEEPLIKYRLSSTQTKWTQLKETIVNTYLIQEKALTKYDYKDSPYNHLYRIGLKALVKFPRLGYLLYKIILK